VKFFEIVAGTDASCPRWFGDNSKTVRYDKMRKLLLSTVSVAALVTLAACSDETAENTEGNPTAVEQTAEVDTTIPSAEEQATIPDNGMTGESMSGDDTQMQAGAETGTDTMTSGDTTAAADASSSADVEEAKQAVADARDAIQSQSESAAVQALIDVERAIDNLDDPAEAQQAVDETRNQVIEGNFEAALASLSDVEIAIDASAQASADTAVTDETTASTTE